MNFYQLWKIAKLLNIWQRKIEILIYALVSSRLDYCDLFFSC